ncbi:MAG: AarF/UbiB family protein [Oligoflexales bacterium]
MKSANYSPKLTLISASVIIIFSIITCKHQEVPNKSEGSKPNSPNSRNQGLELIDDGDYTKAVNKMREILILPDESQRQKAIEVFQKTDDYQTFLKKDWSNFDGLTSKSLNAATERIGTYYPVWGAITQGEKPYSFGDDLSFFFEQTFYNIWWKRTGKPPYHIEYQSERTKVFNNIATKIVYESMFARIEEMDNQSARNMASNLLDLQKKNADLHTFVNFLKTLDPITIKFIQQIGQELATREITYNKKTNRLKTKDGKMTSIELVRDTDEKIIYQKIRYGRSLENEFKTFQDALPPIDGGKKGGYVDNHLKLLLGDNWSSEYTWDKSGRTAGSIAEVIRLIPNNKTQEVIRVKILRPNVESEIEKGIARITRSLKDDVSQQAQHVRGVLVHMRGETNFKNEVNNVRKAQALKRGKVQSVRIVGKTTDRAFAMTEARGQSAKFWLKELEKGKLNDSQKKKLRNALKEAHDFLQNAILTGGVIHSDPHPGNYNIEITDRSYTVFFYDWGRVSQLNQAPRVGLSYFSKIDGSVDKLMDALDHFHRTSEKVYKEFASKKNKLQNQFEQAKILAQVDHEAAAAYEKAAETKELPISFFNSELKPIPELEKSIISNPKNENIRKQLVTQKLKILNDANPINETNPSFSGAKSANSYFDDRAMKIISDQKLLPPDVGNAFNAMAKIDDALSSFNAQFPDNSNLRLKPKTILSAGRMDRFKYWYRSSLSYNGGKPGYRNPHLVRNRSAAGAVGIATIAAIALGVDVALIETGVIPDHFSLASSSKKNKFFCKFTRDDSQACGKFISSFDLSNLGNAANACTSVKGVWSQEDCSNGHSFRCELSYETFSLEIYGDDTWAYQCSQGI